MNPSSPAPPSRGRPGWGLARLAWRRALPLPVVVLVAGVALFALTRDWGLPPDALDGALSDAQLASLERGFARQGVWLLLLLVILPLLVHRAAATFAGGHSREREWLSAQPASALALVLPSFLGLAGVALLLLATTAALAEFAAGPAGPTLRFHHPLPHPPLLLLAGEEAARWELADDTLAARSTGAVVRMRPTVAPGSGPAVSIRATVGSTGGANTHERRARIFAATSLEVPVPPDAAGRLCLELARESEGAVLVLPEDRIDLLVPLTSDRRVGAELAARLGLAALAAIALGLGFGAWMRTGIAAFLVLVGWMIPWWWGFGAAWLPGGDLPQVWIRLGEGIAPALLDPRALVGTAAALLIGLLFAATGLRRGGAA